jgi:hypothetical protein
VKKTKSLEIFYRTVSATGEQKAVFKSIRCRFSSLYEATSCSDILQIMLRRVQEYEKSQFQCLIIFLTIGFREKNIITRV